MSKVIHKKLLGHSGIKQVLMTDSSAVVLFRAISTRSHPKTSYN